PLGRFARQHAGVNAYAGGTDYAVIAIDLGGYPSRNLSNFRDFALVGVRNGRIEWISPPTSPGPSRRSCAWTTRAWPGHRVGDAMDTASSPPDAAPSAG
ncbi:MAG: hypothetical protein ACXU8S_15310, partial [Phenylobacterium sp.]